MLPIRRPLPILLQAVRSNSSNLDFPTMFKHAGKTRFYFFFKYTGIYFRSDYYGEYLVDSHGFRIYIHCFHARYCINHLKKLQQQNNIKSFNWILHQDHLPALGCSKSQGCVKPGLWTSCHARTQEQRKLNKPFSDPIVCE